LATGNLEELRRKELLKEKMVKVGWITKGGYSK
jgi:hypothetical protein